MTLCQTQYLCNEIVSIQNFIRRFPLATIFSIVDGKPLCSHIPIFWMDESASCLVGHADARNPQFSAATSEKNSGAVYLVFMGGDCYIPPEAYLSRQLPTWNYISVHAEGNLELCSDPAKNFELIRLATDRLKSASSDFSAEPNDPRIQHWINGVVGLKIKINVIQARYKLSQDKSPSDVRAAAEFFALQHSARVSQEFLLDVAGATASSGA